MLIFKCSFWRHYQETNSAGNDLMYQPIEEPKAKIKNLNVLFYHEDVEKYK